MRRSARQTKQATRRAKYGGKTFFGRMIKSGIGIAGGLLTGNPMGALQSALTSQKVDPQTPAEMQQRAEAVQQLTEGGGGGASFRNDTPAQQQQRAALEQEKTLLGASLIAQNPIYSPSPQVVPKKNNTIKFIVIGVVTVLVIVVIAKVLGGNKTK